MKWCLIYFAAVRVGLRELKLPKILAGDLPRRRGLRAPSLCTSEPTHGMYFLAEESAAGAVAGPARSPAYSGDEKGR
jgi:hypothetical protein